MRKKLNRGSSIVEMLVLMPVILLVLLAMYYLGELTVFKGRTHFAGMYAMDEAGSQNELGAERGTLSTTFYPRNVGELTATEYAPAESEIPGPGEIDDIFDFMTTPVYSTYATGRYVMSGGRLQFVVETSQSSRLSRDGNYVNAYGLNSSNVPQLAYNTMVDWQVRNRIDLLFHYAPAYVQVGKYPLDPLDITTSFQSTIRGIRDREVTNPTGGMSHQIETVTDDQDMVNPGTLQHYPDFSGDEPFWEPN